MIRPWSLLQALTLAALLIALLIVVFWRESQAAGGTNGLLGRMETMVSQLATTGELTPAEAADYRERIQTLREQVEARIEKNGGSINTTRDKDIYNAINAVNAPIFARYQQSRAKKQADPRQLGYPPPGR